MCDQAPFACGWSHEFQGKADGIAPFNTIKSLPVNEQKYHELCFSVDENREFRLIDVPYGNGEMFHLKPLKLIRRPYYSLKKQASCLLYHTIRSGIDERARELHLRYIKEKPSKLANRRAI